MILVGCFVEVPRLGKTIAGTAGLCPENSALQSLPGNCEAKGGETKQANQEAKRD